MFERMNPQTTAPELQKPMFALTKHISEHIDPTLFELVKLRASMINGCGHCVDIHSNDALGAGETTARLMSTSFRILGERPDLQATLRAESDKIPAFIEEALRLEPPIKGEFRLSKVAVTVGDEELAPGTSVFVLNGAANRDPRQFEDPLDFLLRCFELTSDLLVIDTHLASEDFVSHGCSDRLTTRAWRGATYLGREAVEDMQGLPPAEIEALNWAAWGHSVTFWLTERSLLDALSGVGFSLVSKVFMRPPYKCECSWECRSIFVARKRWPVAIPR